MFNDNAVVWQECNPTDEFAILFADDKWRRLMQWVAVCDDRHTGAREYELVLVGEAER